MPVYLQPVVASQKDVLGRYLQLYLYDYAVFNGNKSQDGFFNYPWLENYFVEEDRHPFFIMNEEEIVGFVFVKTLGEKHYQMSEFFIMNTFRKQGFGKKAAELLFQKFQGKWSISQEASNAVAVSFWHAIISLNTDAYQEKEMLSDHGEKRIEQTFCTTTVKQAC